MFLSLGYDIITSSSIIYMYMYTCIYLLSLPLSLSLSLPLPLPLSPSPPIPLPLSLSPSLSLSLPLSLSVLLVSMPIHVCVHIYYHNNIFSQCYFSSYLCFLEWVRQLNKPDTGKVYAVVGSTFLEFCFGAKSGF